MVNRIYQVIYDDLSVQIAEGVLQPDARLPSGSDLSSRTATASAVDSPPVAQADGVARLP